MGKNAITVYLLAEGGIPEWILSMFYVQSDPEQNLAEILYSSQRYWGYDPDHFRRNSDALRWGILAWCALYIAVWIGVAGVLNAKGIFIKL